MKRGSTYSSVGELYASGQLFHSCLVSSQEWDPLILHIQSVGVKI